MKKYIFLFSVLVVSTTINSNAQNINEIQISLATPGGEFADDDALFYDEDSGYYFAGDGGAATGIYLGYKFMSPINIDGWYWSLSAGFMYNDFASGIKDDWEKVLDGVDSYTLPKYYNIPIFAGLQYEKVISDGFNLFGETGIGLNTLILSDFNFEETDYQTHTLDFEPSVKLGLKLGGGVVFQNKYVVTLNYLLLGSHKVNYEVIEFYGENDFDNNVEMNSFDKALQVRSMNVTFGIRL